MSESIRGTDTPTLTDFEIQATYQGVIHARGRELPTNGQAQLYDGVGNETALQLGRDNNGITVGGRVDLESVGLTGNPGDKEVYRGPLVPLGGIIMWSGNVTDIPAGWKLCDGSNNTPDLSGKFIVGYSESDTDYNVIGNTAGEKEVTLTVNQMPSHKHEVDTMTGQTLPAGGHSHTTASYGLTRENARTDSKGKQFGRSIVKSGQETTNTAGSHIHQIQITGGELQNTGGGQAHENRPPYFVLAFIQYRGE